MVWRGGGGVEVMPWGVFHCSWGEPLPLLPCFLNKSGCAYFLGDKPGLSGRHKVWMDGQTTGKEQSRMGQGIAGQTLSRVQLCKILGEEGPRKRPREKRVASSQQGPRTSQPSSMSTESLGAGLQSESYSTPDRLLSPQPQCTWQRHREVQGHLKWNESHGSESSPPSH